MTDLVVNNDVDLVVEIDGGTTVTVVDSPSVVDIATVEVNISTTDSPTVIEISPSSGEKGDKGDTGATGPQGPAGPNSISNTTITLLEGILYGDNGTVTNVLPGNGITISGGFITASGGTTNHSELHNLDFLSSGHTGFQESLGFTPIDILSNNWIELTNGGITSLHKHQNLNTLIPPASNILTLTAADNYNLTVPATLTVAGLEIANVFTQVQTMPTINIGSSFYNSNVANNLKMPAASWAQQTGTVSTGAGGYTVTGTGTLFLSEYKIGDEIGIDDLSGVSPAYWGVVTAIASNTSMTTDQFWSAEASSNHRRRNPLFEMRNSANTALWLVNTNGMAFGGANFQNTGGVVFGGTNTFLFSQYNYTTPNTTGTSNTRFYWDNTGGGNRGTWYSNSQNMQINAAAGTLRLTSYAGVEVLAQNNFQPFSVTGYTTQTLPVVLFIDNTAATNVVRNVLKLETQSTGTAANGLGAGLLYSIETATASTMQSAARVYASWVDATNATRKAKLSLSAYDTAERIGLEIAADGSDVTLLALGKLAFTQTDLNEYIDSLADGYIDYRATTGHRFGDGTNSLNISATGDLTLTGTATVFLDQFVDGLSLRPGASAPTFDVFKNGVWANFFVNGATDEAHGSLELQHDYKEGSDLEVHVHWSPDTVNVGNCRWNFEYTVANMSTGIFGATTTLTIDAPTDGTAYKNIYTTLGTISGTGRLIGDVIMFRVYRSGTHANDTYTGRAALLRVACHYESDKLGSS